MDYYSTHLDLLHKAIKALRDRTFFAAWPEHPKAYPEDGDKAGREAFKDHLGKEFKELDADGPYIGSEESPYTQKPLGISYPSFVVEELIEQADTSYKSWRNLPKDAKAGLLIESLERFKTRFFEVAYATMHTTGQGYMMAFQASGPHAADRALEAIAAGYEELGRFPEKALWDKPMGKYNIVLEKSWRAVPRGISVVIGCSTFPVWNSLPGIFGSLMTGNPVIVKPHPGAILPIAIVVAEIRNVLREAGLPADICQLAPDVHSAPITKILAEHKSVKILDFTGNSEFGAYLEGLKGKEVFTEKTGVNSAIIDSAANIDKVAANLAFSVALYSGQMCTAPQNFFVPEEGIKTPDGVISFDEFASKFSEQITGLVDNPKAGPFVLGAIQNKQTCERTENISQLGGKIILESRKIDNPIFPDARVLSPAILQVDSGDTSIFNKELFGPIAILIKTKDTDESIELARDLAIEKGAISCAAYTTDEQVKSKIVDEMSLAATPVSINLTGGIYVNQNAGFSDFHVSGEIRQEMPHLLIPNLSRAGLVGSEFEKCLNAVFNLAPGSDYRSFLRAITLY